MYSEEDIVQNLKDAGCDDKIINDFMTCISLGEQKKEFRLLAQHREKLLDEVHKGQKQIDCLDYLVYQLNK